MASYFFCGPNVWSLSYWVTLPEIDASSIDSLKTVTPKDWLLFVLIFGPHLLFLKAVLGFVFMVMFKAWRLGVRGVCKAAISAALGLLRAYVPGVETFVQGEVKKELSGIENEMHGDGDVNAIIRLPEKGTPSGKLKQSIEASRKTDPFIANGGKLWAGIYHEAENELTDLQAKVWELFNTSNALYPKEFPSLRKMEAEVISMTVGLVHGHECGAVGLLSSGGTESVLLAALAYREQGRKRGIRDPQIICGISAHPAITKACHYFGIELVKAPLDPKTMRLTARTVRPLLSRRTVAIYASAPCFSFGVVDDVASLGALAQRHGVGLHVDNCLGGFLLSFMQREGLWGAP